MACFLQTHACSFTRMFFRRFYAEIRLLTQRCFYTEMLSHTETLLHTFFFTQRWFYIKEIYTQKPLQTHVLLQRKAFIYTELFHTDVFAQIYFWMISDCGHTFRVKEFSKQMQNRNVTTAFDDWEAFRAKGLQGHKQNRNITVIFEQSNRI
jgi:hypothetical protein